MNALKSNILATRTLGPAFLLALALFSAPLAMAVGPLGAEESRAPRSDAVPDELKNITIDEHLNGVLPLDATFVDERNQPVKLGQYFTGKRPVVIQLGYYGCPMLCDYVSRGLTRTLKSLDLDPGKDFDVIFISIDPNESWPLAQKKKQAYVTEYARGGADVGLHFLTGRSSEIARVAGAVGFNYKWVPSVGQFSHPAVIAIATPEGKLSRYIYGVQFNDKTLRLSLVEASAGKIGTTADHFLLTCYQFDGRQGKYALAAMSLMRIGGAVCAVIFACVLTWLFRRDARRQRQAPGADPTTTSAA